MNPIKKRILIEMFGDDSENFAVFESIVKSLVEKGEVLSSEHALTIDFGECSRFITISDEVEGTCGIYKFTFDIESASKTSEFNNRLVNVAKEISDKINEINDNLKFQSQLMSYTKELLGND